MVKNPLRTKEEKDGRSLDKTIVEFGDVAAGFSSEKTLHLQNMSPVNATFQILQPSSISNLEKVFTCSQYHGVIAPGSVGKIKVKVISYEETMNIQWDNHWLRGLTISFKL